MTTRERKRLKRAHRINARALINGGTLFNAKAPVGSNPWHAAQWHLKKARSL